MSMLSKSAWARAAALTGAVAMAMIATAIPAEVAFAQETPSVALEQARKGEDGTTGTGADPGSMESGNAKRDKSGNGENASAGSAGEVATADGSSGATEGSGPPLPENAEVLDALGILDDVTVYGLDVLSGLDIPVEVLPPPPAETAPSTPDDINTGGQGSDGASDSTVSTEPGSGTGPAGGSTTTAAEDGTGSTSNGEKPRDRPRKNADGGTDTADTGDGGSTTTGS
jgi:hypothetical protein